MSKINKLCKGIYLYKEESELIWSMSHEHQCMKTKNEK